MEYWKGLDLENLLQSPSPSRRGIKGEGEKKKPGELNYTLTPGQPAETELDCQLRAGISKSKKFDKSKRI